MPASVSNVSVGTPDVVDPVVKPIGRGQGLFKMLTLAQKYRISNKFISSLLLIV